jgi:hypothetical protein
MNTRIAPVSIEIGTRDLWKVLRGFRVSLFRDEPFDPDRIPDGWYFPDHPWPSGLTHYTDYWVHVWREGGKLGEHVTIKPAHDGWWVDYDPENSMFGGFLLGPKFDSYERAVEVAIDAMDRVENGADYRDVRYHYDKRAESSENC